MLFEQNIASNVTRNVILKYGKAHPSMPKHAQARPTMPKHSEQLLGTYGNLLTHNPKFRQRVLTSVISNIWSGIPLTKT